MFGKAIEVAPDMGQFAASGCEGLEVPAAITCAGASKSDFLGALFRAFLEHQVRYCVLHTWKELPAVLPSDLDIAVHPSDRGKLPVVFETLRAQGFVPVQCQNYEAHGYAFFFFCVRGSALRIVQLDVIFEYRLGGLILTPGEELVAGRRQFDSLWVADPVVAFRYLLVKKVIKGAISSAQQRELKELVGELGRAVAINACASLFGEKWKERAVDACLDGTLGTVIGPLRNPLRQTLILRNPISPIRYFFGDAVRLVRRWLKPTGIFVVMLGPDGVGKSAVAARLLDELRPVFDRQRAFHFRPQFIAPQKRSSLPAANPQDTQRRGVARSIAQLFGFYADCWIGYLVSIRPFLSRSGLVIFDRYFHDLTIDSTRYRYGGPRRLPQLLAHFLPPVETAFLVLDAQVDVILSRKREIGPEELNRLRSLYTAFARKSPYASLIKTDRYVEESVAAALRAICLHLAERFERRYPEWQLSNNSMSGEGKAAGITPR